MLVGLFQSVVILVTCLGHVFAYSSGAVTSVCTSMTPGHMAAAQSGTAPYEVDVGGATCYSTSASISVTVRGTSGDTFRGLLVQARQVGMTTIVGQLSESSSDLQTLNCGSGVQDAVSHTSNTDKSSVSFSFTATADHGDIQFRATVVQVFSTIYEGIVSSTLTYDMNCTSGNNNAPHESAGWIIIVSALIGCILIA